MDALRIMFFYEFTHLNRSVFALFAPSLHEGRIYIVNRTPVGVSNVEKLYKDEYKKLYVHRGFFRNVFKIASFICIEFFSRKLKVQLACCEIIKNFCYKFVTSNFFTLKYDIHAGNCNRNFYVLRMYNI